MENKILTSIGAEDFDPESLLEDVSNKIPKQQQTDFYEDLNSDTNTDQLADSKELSKNTGFPIVSVSINMRSMDKIEIAGILNSLTANSNSAFLHVEMSCLANVVLDAFSYYSLSSTDDILHTQLLELKTNIDGKETTMNFESEHSYFLKSFICKDFQGKTVLCKLVFARADDYLSSLKANTTNEQ